MFRNAMPRYEILSEDAMDTLDGGWRRLVSRDRRRVRQRPRPGPVPPGGPEGRGVRRVRDRPVRPRLRAGTGREGAAVVRRAGPQPRELRAHRRRRDGVRRASTGRRSCARATSAGTPRSDDFENFTRLAQSFSALDSAGGIICEPENTPLDSRHLDMTLALQTLTDKIYMGNVVSGVNARDTLAMTEILFGGRETIERTPATISLINCNSPLRWDERMLEVAARLRRGEPGRRDHAVPADGRDVAGVDPGDAGPADGRGAHRHRALPAGPAGLPGDLRLVPVQHRHAVGLAVLRHAGVGRRAALHRADRAPVRAAGALRRRADVEPDAPTRRPATRR